jgi:hypothetical protein
MSLPVGTYKGVRCRCCAVKGVVTVHDDGRVTESHVHRGWCRYAPVQPEHFKRRRRRVQRQEAAIATAASGLVRLTPASGALGPDNDARLVGGWRFEAKSTESDRWVVTQAFWAGLCARSLRNDEEPMLVVDFLTPGGATERLGVFRLAAWVEDAGPPPTLEEPLARTTYHLRPLPREPRVVRGLVPAAVVTTFEHWLSIFKDPR